MILLQLLSTGPWQNLAVTLLHSLWQGALVLTVLAFLLRVVRDPNHRYGLSLGALLILLTSALTTWAILNHRESASPPAPTTELATPASPDAPPEVSASIPGRAPKEQGAGNQWLPTRSRTVDYRPVLILVWLAGVVFMSGRLFVQLLDANDLRLACRPLDEDAVILAAEKLRRLMNIGRAIELRVAENIVSPLVLGVVWPVIVLPVTAVSGMNPETLRAILAHELAHIRRHDYLVNIAQMVIETVLFFNPAVWWISRQVQIEREACCDKAASLVTGNETAYAEALATFAEQSLSGGALPTPAQAFGRKRKGGQLLDRVRRLLEPEYQPRIRLPWPGIATVILTGGLLLVGLQQGTRLAVAAGAKWLTPQERIARIQDLKESQKTARPYDEYDPSTLEQPESQVTLSGTVRLADGKSVNGLRVSLQAEALRPSYHSGHSFSLDDGRFEGTANPGDIHLCASAEGYAPAFLGPLKGTPGRTFRQLELVLKPGFECRVRFVDPSGAPIEGVELNGAYDQEAYSRVRAEISDSNGVAVLRHCAPLAANLEFWKPGYQHDRRRLLLQPDQTVKCELLPATATRVRLLTTLNDRPIAGAKARLIRINGPKNKSWSIETGPVLANSDADGVLTLDQLRDDSIYWFLVEAEGHHPDFLRQLRPGMPDQSLHLGPALNVAGKVTGDLSRLPTRRRSQPYISFDNPWEIDGTSMSYWKGVGLDVRDGEGFFLITNLLPGKIHISAGGERITRRLGSPLTNLVINLDSREATRIAETREKRTVLFRFHPPEGQPPPGGQFHVNQTLKRTDGGHDFESYQLDIVRGAASVEVEVPGDIRYETEGLVGYWVAASRGTPVAAGDSPLMIDVPCHPAGAIYGTLRDSDGSPARGVMISVVEAAAAPDRPDGTLDVDVKNSTSGDEETDRFLASPLPLGGRYCIVAHRGASYAVSEEISLSETNPIRSIDLAFVEGVTVRGRAMRWDGEPAAGIQLELSYSPHPSHGFRPGEVRTDRLGRFAFESVNPEAPGVYRLIVRDNPGYQPKTVEINPKGEELVVTLNQGQRLTGQVVDDATGWPIPGLEVYALPEPILRTPGGFIDANGKTDGEGRFLFDTLDDGPYQIRARGTKQDGNVVVNGGSTKPVTLRVTLPDWSKLRPLPPIL